MYKKEGVKDNKINIAIILVAIIAIIALGSFMIPKPAITGFFIITKETTHSDNLNLVVNESKNVSWFLKNPGDIKSIKATGGVSRNGSAKVYLEKDGKKILIFDSTKQLFDVNVQVLPDYKKIFQGDELLVQIILFNLRGFGSADVSVKYSIKDTIGNLIAVEEEIVSVETQAKFVRKLLIPSDLKPGTYTAFVEVTTPDGLVGTSSDSFEVSAKYEKTYPLQIKYYLIGVAVLFVLAIIVILSLQVSKKLKKKKDIMELKEKIPEEKAQKLEKELKAVESMHKSGFISSESYKRRKEKIEEKLKRLKRTETKEEKTKEKISEEQKT